ncbi:unnamed protein product [Closterium sp. Yama58-4]|nr:unnamed protein product [Closterium sp. Yama58-4]
MQRLGFRSLTRAGEAAAADMEAVTRARLWCPELINHLGVSPKDLFNLDETCLIPACQPRKTWASKTPVGGKTAKDRLTVVFMCNADGSEMFRPMVISKVRRPRDFTDTNFDPEPYVYWRYNKRGWMTSEIFTAFIESLNTTFFAEERQVVLLVDNASCHCVETAAAVRQDILGFRTVKLSNIRVVYLPPNTTAYTQPLDQGVISAVKARFRQKVIADWLRQWDGRGSPASPQPLKPKPHETVLYLFAAWEAVETETIQRCWFNAGILPRSWRALMPLGSTWTSDLGDTTEELEYLGRQLAALNLGSAAMSATEFNTVDDHVPICDFTAPDPLADEPPRTRGARPSMVPELITPALRERRRVARRATEILVGYARASNMMPRDLAVIFGITNPEVIERLERASRATINLNDPPENSAQFGEDEAPEDSATSLRRALSPMVGI